MADNDGKAKFPPSGYFSSTKYKTPKHSGLVDGSNTLANAGQVISFLHEATGNSVYFKAFLTAFNESYASDWTGEVVFGRADPIQHFKQTSRRISLAFKIPSATYSEAYENLAHLQQLVQYLYPNYSGTTALSLSQNPFIRLKLMNLAQKVDAPADSKEVSPNLKTTYESYKSTGDPERGLLGAITSLNIAHNLENPDIGSLAKDGNTIFSKMIEVNLDFAVIHESQLGWNEKGDFRTPNFPYGAASSADVTTTGQIGGNMTAQEKAELRQAKEAALRHFATMGGKARLKRAISKAYVDGHYDANTVKGANARYYQSMLGAVAHSMRQSGDQDTAEYRRLKARSEGEWRGKRGKEEYSDTDAIYDFINSDEFIR